MRNPRRSRGLAGFRCIARFLAIAVTYWRSWCAGRMIGDGWRSCNEFSHEVGVPLVAAGDVHYHVPGRMVLHDVLTAIRHGTTVAAAEGTLLFPNAERHLRPVEEIRELFADAPDAIARTMEIAERCTFSLDELRYEYPTNSRRRGKRRWSI